MTAPELFPDDTRRDLIPVGAKVRETGGPTWKAPHVGHVYRVVRHACPYPQDRYCPHGRLAVTVADAGGLHYCVNGAYLETVTDVTPLGA